MDKFIRWKIPSYFFLLLLNSTLSVMEVTTYSGELRQLVPMFQVVFKKPAESADNVYAALAEIDKMMIKQSGTKFEPLQWTTDNSGALENGIIRAKGEQAKPFLASDKLHDHNNIDRVLRTVPKDLQQKLRKEIFKMINSSVPSISENIYECILKKAKDLTDQKLLRSLVFNHRKRHKYWYCYREVQDNNATSEQVNRVMTRHGKGEGLIAGVQRMIRNSIADKSKFKLAANSVMVNNGPSVTARKVRVERSLMKSLPEIISSINEEHNSQEEPDDEKLKKKALEDFKPKSSDTHRSDKKRRTIKPTQSMKVLSGNKAYGKVKKSLRFNKSVLFKYEVSVDEVSVSFRTSIGIENTLTVSQDCVLCTCMDHSQNYFCADILKFFGALKMEDYALKKKFSKQEFKEIRSKTELLKVSPPPSVEWSLDRSFKKTKCSGCPKFILFGEVMGIFRRKKFHPSRFCLPEEVVNVQARLVTQLDSSDINNLVKNGIQI